MFFSRKLIKMLFGLSLFVVILLSGHQLNKAYATAGYSKTINGVALPLSGSDLVNAQNGTGTGGSQCWGFASWVYKKIFGWENVIPYTYNNSHYVTTFGTTIPTTADNLKTWILRSGPGALLRVCNSANPTWDSDGGSGHSLIIVDANDSGVWTYQSGSESKVFCYDTSVSTSYAVFKNEVQYNTWSEMSKMLASGPATQNGQYIKYILCPPEYRGFAPSFAGAYPCNLGDDFYAYIIHQSDDLCVTNQVNNVGVETFTGTNTQLWRFQRLNNGAYTLLNAYDNSYMDVFGAGTEGGSSVYAYKGSYLDIENQQFYIYHAYNAYYICPVHGKGTIALDVNASTHNVEIYGIAQDWTPQKFDIEISSGSAAKSIPIVTQGNSLKETIISWNSVNGATSYGILIQDLDDNYVHIRWDYTMTTFSALLPAGSYKVKIVAVKESGNIESRTVYFNVANVSTSDIGEMSYHAVWNNTLYALYSKECSWLEAKALSESQGGHLLTITSQEEQNIATTLVSQYGRLVYIGAEGYSSYNWKWVTKEPFTYQNWAQGKPDNWNGTENCGHLYTDGTWNDIGCSDSQVHGFIAEYELSGIQVESAQSTYVFPSAEEIESYKNTINDEILVWAICGNNQKIKTAQYELTTQIIQNSANPLLYVIHCQVSLGGMNKTIDFDCQVEPQPTSLTVTPSDELFSKLTTKDEAVLLERMAYCSEHIREYLTVEVVYSDGSIKAVEDYEVTTEIVHSEEDPVHYDFDFTVTYNGLKDTSSISNTVELKVPPTSVTLNSTTLSLKKGATSTLTATVAPSDATNKSVSWKSSDAKVATVDSTGKVTAVAAGTATITCTTEDGGKTATCTVTVTVPVTGVTVSPTTLSLKKGATSTLTATVAPSDATNKNVTWKSSDTAVATVDTTGKVTAVAAGSATITCTTVDGGKTATCAVTVTVPVTGVTLNSTTLSLKKGATGTLTATVAPSDATYQNVTWKSSDARVATVDTTGKVTAVGGGSATITCTTADGGKTATCAVTVTVPVTGVVLNLTQVKIERYSDTIIEATVLPNDATNKRVVWKSSDTSVATVYDGEVRGVSPGKATITCTSEDGARESTCDIEVYIPVTSVRIWQTKEPSSVYLFMDKGEESPLRVDVVPGIASHNVTWMSSDTSVATVSEDGIVTAVGNGKATISCTTVDSAKNDSIVVIVTTPMTGITIQPGYVHLEEGDSYALKANVYPSDATGQENLRWFSSNYNVVSVSSGVITARRAGKATITCRSADGQSEATCTVLVTIPGEDIVIHSQGHSLFAEEPVLNIQKGNLETVLAWYSESYERADDVVWNSSDSTIATISATGVIKAFSCGTTTITCTTVDGNKTADCEVKVYEVKPDEYLRVIPEEMILRVGEAKRISYEINVAEGESTEVLIHHGTIGYDFISYAGRPYAKIKGTGVGTYSITYHTKDGRMSATCNITVIPAPTIPDNIDELATLMIPGGLTDIAKEGFEGIAAERIILPEGLESIGKRAFADCKSLRFINLPRSLKSINLTAFEGCDNLCLICIPGTYGEQYAKNSDLPYICQ